MPKRIVLKSALLGAVSLLMHASTFAATIGATFVSQSVPGAMQLGQTYAVSVTFKNTGQTPWTRDTNFRLGALNPTDTARWGIGRVDLPVGVSVKPNEVYTFDFNVAVTNKSFCNVYNEQASKCEFQWGLLQEGGAWLSEGHDTEVGLFNVPAITTSFPPVAAPIAVNATAFTAANFRGANLLQHNYLAAGVCDQTAWLPEAADAQILIDKAVSMGMNVLRVPVILPPKVPGTPAGWIQNNPNYAGVCVDTSKSEWNNAADGATATRELITRLKSIMDKADAAGVKVIPALDGYTKYNETCFWKRSFVDVKDNAVTLVNALKTHSALLAWDVINEPLWNASSYNCLHSDADYKSVVDAVHAMYNVVRGNDAVHPTTVGEHREPFLKYWKDISSFGSPHFYPANVTSADPNSLNNINYTQSATMREMGNALGTSLPLVVGEFGTNDPDIAFDGSFTERMLNGFTLEDRGFLQWSLTKSPLVQEFSVIDTDGNLKPAGLVLQRQQWYPLVQQLYLGYTGRPADSNSLVNFAAGLASVAEDMKSRSLKLARSLTALDAAYATEPALRTLIDSFYNSAEFQSIYTPANVSNYVGQIFTQVFNRMPAAAGLQFWSDQINSSSLPKSRAVLSIMAAGTTNTSAQGMLDAATEFRKAAVAGNFTASLNTPARVSCYNGSSARATGRALLAAVNSSTDVKAYQGNINAALVGLCGQ